LRDAAAAAVETDAKYRQIREFMDESGGKDVSLMRNEERPYVPNLSQIDEEQDSESSEAGSEEAAGESEE
jgi:hypothetical protein